jgi:hypothetical protein
MIYIAVLLLIALFLLRQAAPTRHAVHAAVASKLPPEVRLSDKFLGAGFLRDENGKRMNVDDKFIGLAARDSMDRFGIRAGATFIADRLNSDEKLNLRHGDIVVVDGVAAHAPTGVRLRCFDKLISDRSDGDEAAFLADGLGQPRRNRPLEEVVARVTHVLDGPSSQ